jgi:CheY-like chemotaxis protein
MDRCVLLHVEDDDGAAFLFRAALDEAEITASVYRMADPESAIQFLRKAGHYERAKTPRLIVVDLTLPGRDGWWLLRQIQQDPGLQSIPVVVVSFEPSAQIAPKAIAAGAHAYIEKPFDFGLYVEQVKTVCSPILASSS